MARRIDAWWDTMAEGMNTREELKIIFGEGVASILLGEMEDRGDGVYVYKDPKSAQYNLELKNVSCDEIDEREKVEGKGTNLNLKKHEKKTTIQTNEH